MKKYIFSFVFLLPLQLLFSQDIVTLNKIYEVSTKLGIKNSISIDTMLINTRNERISRRVTEQQSLLLKASEYYLSQDYENALYFIKQVEIRFRNNGLNNLSYFISIGSNAHLNLPKATAKWYYTANRINCIEPENLKTIHNEIKEYLTRDEFEKGLSYYYYFHQRMKILAAIYD